MASRNRNRKILVAFYVTNEERAEMYRIAKLNDMTFSDYARRVLLGKIPNTKQEQ